MAEYKDVELVNGTVVRVYRPPTSRFVSMVSEKDPKPVVPVVTEVVKSGRQIEWPVPDDPDFVKALQEWRERGPKRQEEIDQLEALSMLKDVEVPKGWDVEEAFGDIARFYDEDWQPRAGPTGRKLDYIQWELLSNIVDAERVQSAVLELAGIDMAEVQAIQASFRPTVEGETS